VLAVDLPDHRREVLLAQLAALECTARRLAGDAVPFRREIELCMGVPVGPGSEDDYNAAHRELDGLLPGRGPLGERLAAHRSADELPADRLLPAVRALSEALRERVAPVYGLPDGESVGFEVVDDAPWAALHQYRGAHRSVVRLNAAGRVRAGQLAQLVAHEAYPGHHTELCRVQDGPVAAGEVEHAVTLVLSPCSTVAEGLADAGLAALLGPGWGRWAAGVLAEVGVRTDGELTERVDRAMEGLLRVRQDAALLLHDRGASEDDVVAHVKRWSLVSEERARQQLRFLTHPLWRAYISTYVEGFELLSRWLGARPAGQPVAERFLRLLDEPLTPARVTAELRADVGR
jgi:hypothetical protein